SELLLHIDTYLWKNPDIGSNAQFRLDANGGGAVLAGLARLPTGRASANVFLAGSYFLFALYYSYYSRLPGVWYRRCGGRAHFCGRFLSATLASRPSRRALRLFGSLGLCYLYARPQ